MPGEHRADAERRDHGVDADLGDERAVDQPMAVPRASAATIAEPDRQSLVGHQAADDQADEARDEADAEIELADHEGIGQPGGDDRGERRLAEDVEEIGASRRTSSAP